MVHESMRNLKLDKRLARRRNWVAREEVQQALDALPDVAEKGELVRPAEEAAAPGAPSEPPPTRS